MSYTDQTPPRPTSTSGWIAGLTTLGVVALLLWAVPAMVEPTLIGVVGAVCLTVSLWLVHSGVQDTPTAALASALVVPAAVGLTGGAAAGALVVTRRVFPVPSEQLVSFGTLVVAGNVGVSVGCVLGVLGVALGRGNVVDRETLNNFVGIGVLTGSVPLVATTLYIVRAGLTAGGSGTASPPSLGLAGALDLALSPGSARLYLADVLVLVAVALGGVAAALRLLPVGELLADSGGGEAAEPSVTRLFYVLFGVASVSGFVGLVLAPVELLAGPRAFERALGPGLFGFLQGLATAGLLRLLLVGAAVLGWVGAGAGSALRRSARDDTETVHPDRTGPLAVGLVATVGAVAVATPVFRGVVNGIARQLPEPVAVELRDSATQAASVYGEATFALLLVTVLVATTVGAVMLIRVAIGLGYLSAETTGYSLASAGLFVGAAFGATVDVPLWLVYGGIVASLVVWDAGRFGTVLGREIGRETDTSGVEFVHTGGTVLVGVVAAVLAAGVAAGLQGVLGGRVVSPVVLLALVVGILSFVTALR